MTIYHGIKISKSGSDILSTGIANQIFNSEKNCIKIAYTGTVSSSLASGGGSQTHYLDPGFDFAPGFLVWFEIDGNNIWYPAYVSGSYIDYVNCNPYSTTDYLVIPLVNNGSSAHTIIAYYAILADAAL